MPAYALVTGATAGIGRAAAVALARAGFEVFATGRRRDALDAIEAEARAAGLPIRTLPLDVTDAASVERAREAVDRATGGHGLDVLVNNAGYGQFGPLEEVTDADLRAQFETNVFGLMAVTRAFLPAMRRRGSGRVVNVGSLSGLFTAPLMGAYHATKYAVEALSDALRVEVGGIGIRVVLIEPGMIRTGFEDRTLVEAARYGAEGSPYAPALGRFARIVGSLYRRAPGPDKVVPAIVRGATARRPRARYATPFLDRMAIVAARLLPAWVLDRLFRAVLRLPVQG
ncbi:MAG: SDR family oxidoreductase [Deltaproteobacteria bacterium]|nr:SDR family oxidoreductase [Deltaproteobacteria bacterium]